MEKKGGKRLAPTGGAQKPPVTTVPPSAPEGAAPENAAAPAEKPVSRGRKLWNDYGYLLITLAAVFVLFKVILQLAYVPSGSMETTIPTKTLLIGWRLPYVVDDPVPERGDIVTFWDGELEKVLVKRVVGLPGETTRRSPSRAATPMSMGRSWTRATCPPRASPPPSGSLRCRRAAFSSWATTAPAPTTAGFSASRISLSTTCRDVCWWRSPSAESRAGRVSAGSVEREA